MSDEVVTVRATAGKNPGEAIGSHRRHLVFLPRGCEPEREYRVKLVPVGKQDRNGRELFRGVPAPATEAEGWRDNGDGTLSRCWVIKDWKLDEHVQVLETRPKARTDGTPHVNATFTTDWGTDLASSRITVTTVTTIPEMEECLSGYDTWPSYLSTKEVDRRDGGTKVETFAIEAMESTRSGYVESNDWQNCRLRLDYSGLPELYVGLKLTYGADKTAEVRSAKWTDQPAWLQAHLFAPYPVCGCGRERVDTPAGYKACAKCRAEAAQYSVIDELLPAEKRAEFARIAGLCAVAAGEGKAWEGDGGEVLVIALTPHLTPRYSGDDPFSLWRGYLWYYATSEGVFASRFPPEAMMILGGLGSATGRGLLTLSCWLTDRHRTEQCGDDFYARTQVRGEEVEPRPDRYTLERASVAVKLRGTEADRQAALVAKATAPISPSWGTVSDVMQKAEEAFRNHDYTEATRLYVAAAEAQRAADLETARLEAERRRIDASRRHANPWGVREERGIYDAELPTGPQTLFLEKSPRMYQCGDCGRIEKMGKTEWNRYKNTGAARMVCTCGAWSDVSKDTTPATSAPAKPVDKPSTPSSALDLSGLLGKFGRN